MSTPGRPTFAKQPISTAEHMSLALRVHTALWEMVSARAARVEEWHDLADAINLVDALCDLSKVPHKDMEVWRYRIEEVQIGLAEARRQLPDGKMWIGTLRAQYLIEIVNFYDAALGKLSRGTLQEATEYVKRKIQLARASANDGVLIVD